MSLNYWLQLIRSRSVRRKSKRKTFSYHAKPELLEQKALLSSVTGRVFDDRTADGFQSGEAGVADFPVSLVNNAGESVAETKTDAAGDYQFLDVADGNYAVRFGSSLSQFSLTTQDVGTDDGIDSDVDTATAQTQFFDVVQIGPDFDFDAGLVRRGTARQRALSLDTTLNLRRGRFDDFVDAFGAGEKWLKGERTPAGGEWYFVLPNGDLHAWDGTRGAASGTLIASFGQDVYDDTTRLFSAGAAPEFEIAGNAAQKAYDLDQSLDLFTVGAWAESYGGLGVKWMAGRTNEYDNPWYFVTPKGRFYAWDGRPLQATGTLITALTPEYFDDAVMLTNARRPLDNPTNAMLAGVLREAFQLSTASVPAGAPADSGPWFQGTLNEFGNAYYFLDDSAVLRSWDGSGTATGNAIETLDATFSRNPNLLAFADFYIDTSTPQSTAVSLDRHYQLRSNGHYFDDWAGAGEKWIVGRQDAADNPWYFILPNGEFYQYKGPGRVAEGQLLATLPTQYYDDPTMLHIAFPNLPTAAPPGVVGLSERDDFLTEYSVDLVIGTDEGSSALEIEFSDSLDPADRRTAVGDLFQVYVVDPADPSRTLLDGGLPGQPVFSVGENGSELAAGTVFDGQTIRIDTSSLPNNTDARLSLRLLNNDRDTDSQITVKSISTIIDTESPAVSVDGFDDDTLFAPGGPLNADGMNVTSDIEVDVSGVSFDPVSGQYRSLLTLHNFETSTGRDVAVVFPGLPDDVQLTNASGTDVNGNPYIGMQEAIPRGGFREYTISPPVELFFSNASAARFLQEPVVLVGQPNTAPQLDPIADQTLMPGEILTIPLAPLDADGDLIVYSLDDRPKPTLLLDSGNELVIRPGSDDVGTYSFTLHATDGVLDATQEFTVAVSADQQTTTRVMGVIENTSHEPLRNVTVSIGDASAVTGIDGRFTLTAPSGGFTDDALLIDPENVPGTSTYPTIAEKLHLLFDGGNVVDGQLNTVHRPIYLPALDMATATTVDPSQTTVITSDAIPNARVIIPANSLIDHSGNPYTGQVTLTEVPPDLTPAALPVGLIPGLVITVQPGEMQFTQPAALTLPNVGNFAPGELLDMWSVNPFEGDFEIVGTLRVSADGTVQETIEGGITWTSWTLAAQRGAAAAVAEMAQNFLPPNLRGKKIPGTSEIDGHTGALTEEHELIGYQSQGQNRGLTLVYDSERADPRHAVHYGQTNVTAIDGFLSGRVEIRNGKESFVVPGYNGPDGEGLQGNEHFRRITPTVPQDVAGSIVVDFRTKPTGVYDYHLDSGVLRRAGNRLVGNTTGQGGKLVAVNLIDGPFGAGWSLDGWQWLVENEDGSVLFVNGNGIEAIFGAPQQAGQRFQSPPGDYSSLVKLPDGTFRRTSATGTVQTFAADGFLTSETDRNNNTTTWNYWSAGLLTEIVDPVGLKTTFSYNGTRVEVITDPAGRQTRFGYDTDGNLILITDPDGSTRQFGYDTEHHMTSETDQRGNSESILYDATGRVREVVRKDGSRIAYQPAQTQNIQPAELTSLPPLQTLARQGGSKKTPPVSLMAPANIKTRAPNGDVLTAELDQIGQLTAFRDSLGLLDVENIRDANGNALSETDARGNRTIYTYDDRGNVLTIQDQLAIDSNSIPPFDSLLHKPIYQTISASIVAIASGDLDGDGGPDLVTQGRETFLSNGDGSLMPSADLGGVTGRDVQLIDLNDDGHLDRLTLQRTGDVVTVDLGAGDGTFTFLENVAVNRTDHDTRAFTTGDFDGNGTTDLFVGLIDPNNRFGLSSGYFLVSGRGDGTFDPATFVSFTYDASGEQRAAAADMDGDGDTDIVLGHDGTVRILSNNGNGAFVAGPGIVSGQNSESVSGLFVEDFGGNGLPDIAISFSNDDTFLAIQDPSIGFTLRRLNLGTGSREVQLADMNGDNIPDVVVARGNGAVTVIPRLLNNNLGTPHTFHMNGGVGDFELVDFDGDGDRDLAAIGGESVSVALNPGDGVFAANDYSVSGTPTEIRLADVTNDGIADLLSIGGSQLTIRPGTGEASFGDALQFATGLGNTNSMEVADLDGDGDLDVVATSATSTNKLATLLNDGIGNFAAPMTRTGGAMNNVRLGDFNGDSIPDVVVARGFVGVAPGNGDGTFGSFTILQDPTSEYGGNAVGDLNDDGNLDIVSTKATGDLEWHIFFGNGDGTFADVEIIDPGTIAGRDVELGDVNADGHFDIVGYGSGRLSVALGDGAGNFTIAQNDVVTNTGSGTLTLADIDMDSTIDVIATDQTRSRLNVFTGIGNGTFDATPQTFSAGQDPLDVKLSDLDNDGDLDAVTAAQSLGGGAVFVTLNRSIEPTRLVNPRVTNTWDPAFSQLTSTTDELGRTTLYDIDPANGNTLSETIVVGQPDSTSGETDDVVTAFTYTLRGQVESVTDPLGRVTRFVYDQFGRLTRQTFADGTLDVGVVAFEYDAAGNQTAVIDELDRRTEFEYDSMNRTTVVRDALGSETTFAYDARGNQIRETDATSVSKTAEFDPLDRVFVQSDALGAIELFTYDVNGNLTSITDRRGSVTKFKYDVRDREVARIDPLGNRRTRTWGPDNNLLKETDENGHTATYTYDVRNRVTSVTDAAGNATRYTYDIANNLLIVVDRLGSRLDFEYDDLDRQTRIIDADPDGAGPLDRPIVAMAYDKNGNRTQLVDPLGNVTDFEFDNRDRLFRFTEPDPDGPGPLIAPVSQFVYDAAGQLLRAIDALGGVQIFEYDAVGQNTVEIDIDPDGPGPISAPRTQFDYDRVGNLIRETDPLGRTSDFGWNANNQLTSITLPDPDDGGPAPRPVQTFIYDAAENLIGSFDPLGNGSTFELDRLGRVISQTDADPDGAGPLSAPVTRFEFDAFGNQTAVTDPLGNVTQFEYDALNRLVTIIDADPDANGPLDSPVTTFAYDAEGQLIATTDALGRVTRTDYDGLGRPIRDVRPDPDGSGPLASPVVTFQYDLNDNLTSFTDARGNASQFEYDALNRQVRRVDPDPDGAGPLTAPVSLFSYDALDRLTEFTDPVGATTQFEYDGLDRLIRETLPDPDGTGLRTSPVFLTEFDLVGNVVATVDANGNRSTFVYDGIDQLIRSTSPDPDGAGPLPAPIKTFRYDVGGRPLSVTDQEGRLFQFEYDNLDRLTRETDPDPDGSGPLTSVTVTTSYDAAGNVLSVANTLGETKQFEYDALLRNVAEIDANDGRTNFRYDAVDNLTKVTDPLNNTTTFTFDALDRVIQETNARGNAKHFRYDASDNLIGQTDRLGRITQFEYDALDRLTTERWLDNAGADERLLSFTYDANSRLTGFSDPSATGTFAFDAVGLLTAFTQTITGLTPTVTLAQTLDNNGNRSTLTVDVGGAEDFTNTYTYDALDRVTQIQQAGSATGNTVGEKRIDFSYDGTGLLTGVSRFEDLAGTKAVAATTWQRDESGRPTSIRHEHNGTELAGYDLRYDAADRITQIVSRIDGTTNYDYDDRGQLVSSTSDFRNDESFVFDMNGNPGSNDDVVGLNNQLQSDATFSYEYDTEGNRIRRTTTATGAVTEYDWDHRNRLIRVTERATLAGAAAQVVEYAYDGLDRRISRTLDPDGDGAQDISEEFFVHDGQDVVLVLDKDDDPQHRYLHGPAVDQIMADENAIGEILWALSDHQGTVRDIADYDEATDSTQIVNHRIFDSFGNLLSETDADVDFAYAFQGRELDEATGLHYFRARHYDSASRRFISEDPIGFAGQDANLNRFVENDPVNNVDPSGLVLTKGATIAAKKLAKVGAKKAAKKVIKRSIKNRLKKIGSKKGGKAFLKSNKKAIQSLKDKAQSAQDAFETDLTAGGIAFEAATLIPVIGDAADLARFAKAYKKLRKKLKAIEKKAKKLEKKFEKQVKAAKKKAKEVEKKLAAKCGKQTKTKSRGERRKENFKRRKKQQTKSEGGADQTIEKSRATAKKLNADPEFNADRKKLQSRAIDEIKDPKERKAARDALKEQERLLAETDKLSGKQKKKLTTLVGGADTKTGKATAQAKPGGSCGCAEDLVQKNLGGDTENLRLTPAVRPRNGEVVPVCLNCQSKFSRKNFIPGTPFKR